MQEYIPNQSLTYVLYKNVAPFIFNKNLLGFNQFFAIYGALPYQNLSFSNGQKSLTIGLSSHYTNLMPLVANSGYGDINSNYIVSNLWAGGLLALSTSNNDISQVNYDIYNNLANS